MKIYKVYAKCVRTTKSVTEISYEEAMELIDEAITDGLNNEDISIDEEEDFDAVFNKLYERAEKFLEENGYFDCGDFRIVYSEEEPSRPNGCGHSVNDM